MVSERSRGGSGGLIFLMLGILVLLLAVTAFIPFRNCPYCSVDPNPRRPAERCIICKGTGRFSLFDAWSATRRLEAGILQDR